MLTVEELKALKYERMTPKDWDLLFNEFTQPLSENKSIQYAMKLWELENQIESGELQFVERRTSKFNVGDIVWFKSLIPINPDGSLVPRFEPLEYRICKVYYNKTKGVTYKVKRLRPYAKAYTIDEKYLFATKEEVLAQIQGEPQ